MGRHPKFSASRDPVVAVTASIRTEDGVRRVRLPAAYLEVLERAHLVPIVLAPHSGPRDATIAAVERVLDLVDGLLLTGGEDVGPEHYGARPSARLGTVNAARDETEIAAVLGARERQLPTLAICRGIQVLNVALGGTLVQDIPTERPGPLNHDPDTPRDRRTHPIHLVAASRAMHALGGDSAVVNSVHHQAVDRVAESLVITATAPDGIIEGVETSSDDPWWVLGVQWHPEEFVRDGAAPDHGLFAAFAAAARAPITAL
jgi:putative glutamine amidotransferase